MAHSYIRLPSFSSSLLRLRSFLFRPFIPLSTRACPWSANRIDLEIFFGSNHSRQIIFVQIVSSLQSTQINSPPRMNYWKSSHVYMPGNESRRTESATIKPTKVLLASPGAAHKTAKHSIRKAKTPREAFEIRKWSDGKGSKERSA